MTTDSTSTNSNEPNIIAGVDRAHDRSSMQKGAFFLIHSISFAICVYVVFGRDIVLLGRWFGQGWQVVDPFRAKIVLAVTALYVVRHGITLFYLLQRRVTWSEAIGLGFFMLLFEVGLCLLAAGLTHRVMVPLGGLDYVAIALVLIGSYLNTYSEMQRKWWKDKPENKGKCYTEGLFRLSMHINYFGDCLLFTGWCILTATLWTLVFPILMASMFVLYHIPGLDSYLEERYGDEFREYKERTKKFIPFIY